jgi:hypothetical protein
MSLRKAAEMALRQLQKDDVYLGHRSKTRADAIEAIRQALAESANSTTDFVEPKALAQPEQEPEWIEDGFGTMWQKCGKKDCGKFVVKIGKVDCWHGNCPENKPERKGSHPEKKDNWVGLTEEDIYEAMDFDDEFEFARALEAKLKEKNNG